MRSSLLFLPRSPKPADDHRGRSESPALTYGYYSIFTGFPQSGLALLWHCYNLSRNRFWASEKQLQIRQRLVPDFGGDS